VEFDETPSGHEVRKIKELMATVAAGRKAASWLAIGLEIASGQSMPSTSNQDSRFANRWQWANPEMLETELLKVGVSLDELCGDPDDLHAVLFYDPQDLLWSELEAGREKLADQLPADVSTRQEPPPMHGPHGDRTLLIAGKPYEINQSFDLLEFLWGKERVSALDVAREVWADRQTDPKTVGAGAR